MVRTGDLQSMLPLEKPASLIFSLLHIPNGIEARLPERPANNPFIPGKTHGITYR